MTIPAERTRALFYAYELLKDLRNPLKTPGVPEEIRDRALHVLRHFPDQSEFECIARNDADGALMGPMLDVATARDWKRTT